MNMASGFQNNQDQLTPTYYRVAVNLSGYDSNVAHNASGAVEPFDYDYFTTLNTAKNKSERRARGNIRWGAILFELQRFSNCEILDVTVQKSGPANETAADDVAISLAFTVGYAQEEYVFNGWYKLTGGANLSDGATPLDGHPWEQLSDSFKAANIQACIKEAVTRGICLGGTDGYTRRYRVMDPTLKEQRDENITVVQPNTPSNIWRSEEHTSELQSH